MQRYFINKESHIDLSTNTIIIRGDDAHHITNVMRMRVNDTVYCCYDGLTHIARIDNLNQREVTLTIIETIKENKELPCSVTIAQGLVRKEKMEEVIDHITEMGANHYIPVIMKRSNVKVSEDKIDKKTIRLNKIAKEAAEQAHRSSVLEVHEPISFKEFLTKSNEYDLCLVAHVDDTNPLYIGDAIKDEMNILVLVGPEGGIDQIEIDELKKHNFKQVTLGKRVLRTEVAPNYIMSVIDYIRGNNHEV